MRPRDALAMAAMIVIWGFNFVLAKFTMGQIPPLLLMAIRFAIAAVALAPFLRRPAVPFSELLLISFTMGTVQFSLMFAGLAGVPAGVAAVAAQLYVPFGVLLARIVFGERVSLRQMVGMAMAFLGVAIMSRHGAGEVRPLSLAMVVDGAFVFALASIQVKRLGPVPPFELNGWIAILAAPQILIASLVFEDGHWRALAGADWRAWGSVAYIGLVATVGALGLYYHLIARYPVSRIMPMTLMAPVLAAALAVPILGEPVTARGVVGGLLTVAGVAIIAVMRKRRAAAADEDGRP